MPEDIRPCKGCGSPVYKRHRTGRWPHFCTVCKTLDPPLEPRLCRGDNCATQFTPTSRIQVYCSEKCSRQAASRKLAARQKAARQASWRHCKCGQKIYHKHPEQHLCSRCRVAAREHHRVCDHCHRSFTTKVRQQRYCGKGCAQADKNDRAAVQRMATRIKRFCVTHNDIGAYKQALRRDPCVYCGEPSDTLDHLTPANAGGSGRWENLAAACRSCNSSKQRSSVLAFLDQRRDADLFAALVLRRKLLP